MAAGGSGTLLQRGGARRGQQLWGTLVGARLRHFLLCADAAPEMLTKVLQPSRMPRCLL